MIFKYVPNSLICFTGYIKDFQVHDPHRVGRISVNLQGRVKDCRVLTYRQDIKAQDIENYRLRTLPTRQVLYISTIFDNRLHYMRTLNQQRMSIEEPFFQ